MTSGSTTSRPTASASTTSAPRSRPTTSPTYSLAGRTPTAEKDRARTEQSFLVPKDDIVAQGYDLSLNRYKEVVHDEIEHREPLEIIADIETARGRDRQGPRRTEGDAFVKSVALADACNVVTDGTHYTPPDIGSGVPFLTVKDVGPSGLDFAGCARISEDDYAAADAGTSAPKPGDVLFSKDGTVGKVHVVETDEPFAVLSSLAILRPSESVESKYLGHMLRTPDVLAQAVRRKSGSAVRRIILSDLKKVEIPLPPLPEQCRIAAILDHADALRAKRRQVLAHLDALGSAHSWSVSARRPNCSRSGRALPS